MSDTSVGDPGGSGSRGFGKARGSGGAKGSLGPKRSVRMSKTTILRIIVLMLAAASGYGAIQLAGNTPEPQAIMVTSAPVIIPTETEDVLVTSAELPLGKVITPDDVAWIAWPKKLVVEPAIYRSAAPKARDEMIGALVRSPMLKGEPVRVEKIIRPNGASGILAAMLPSGYRAMAINIDSQGGTTAGGFILPNDRVDIIRTQTRPDPQRGGEPRIESETLLANVRVLAIGQNIQERNGERVVTGSNATLEVDPSQAELLAQAQRSGQIALTLRSMSDSGTRPSTVSNGQISVPQTTGGFHMLTVGVMRAGKRQEYSVREVGP
jgi:pilus assembly protein CpaB